MTLHDVAIAHGYWKRNPPLRVLVATVAASLGVDLTKLAPPKGNGKIDYDLGSIGPQHMSPEAFKRMVDMTGGKIAGVGQFGG